MNRFGGHFGKNVTLTLSEGRSWDQYKWFAVCCLNSSPSLAHIRLPPSENLTVPVYEAVSSLEPVTLPSWTAWNAGSTRSLHNGGDSAGTRSGAGNLGRLLGSLDSDAYGIRGMVYAASADTLILSNFSYDGRAPESNFIVGTAGKTDGPAFIVRNEFNSEDYLEEYLDKTMLLRLPAGKEITDFKWFGVYSAAAKTTLASVDIPPGLDYPKPTIVATRIGNKHTFVEQVVVEDKKTIGLNHFFYDAMTPDAFFVAGKDDSSVSQWIVIQQEGDRIRRLREYVGESVRLTLPGNVTVDDIDWFSVYCINCSAPLLQVEIPKALNVPTDTQWLRRKLRQAAVVRRLQQAPADPSKFGNCEAIIADTVQVAWHLETDAITFHVRAVAMPGMWTAFGISGAADKSMMVGSDVAVLFIKKPDNKVTVVDFSITAKAQCQMTNGVCADAKQDLTVKSSSYANGIVEAVYSRKLDTGDSNDKVIPGKGNVAVVAAQGPTNVGQPDTVLYHTKIVTRQPVMLQFDRAPARKCPPLSGHQVPPPSNSKRFGGRDLFKKYNIDTFTARIGPTAGDRGYETITGQSGWGISWWINNELIPVLHVERGKTYKFIVEGGADKSNPARYHPFYITDSSKGGGSKEDAASLGKPGNRLFAGVVLDAQGKVDESKGTGRLCQLDEDPNGSSDKAATFEEYNKTLKLTCDPGQSGQFTWTPDKDTPDVVYYQCFTHYYLGWKISVTNAGDEDKPLATDAGDAGDKDHTNHGKGGATRNNHLPTLLLLIGCVLARLL